MTRLVGDGRVLAIVWGEDILLMVPAAVRILHWVVTVMSTLMIIITLWELFTVLVMVAVFQVVPLFSTRPPTPTIFLLAEALLPLATTMNTELFVATLVKLMVSFPSTSTLPPVNSPRHIGLRPPVVASGRRWRTPRTRWRHHRHKFLFFVVVIPPTTPSTTRAMFVLVVLSIVPPSFVPEPSATTMMHSPHAPSLRRRTVIHTRSSTTPTSSRAIPVVVISSPSSPSESP